MCRLYDDVYIISKYYARHAWYRSGKKGCDKYALGVDLYTYCILYIKSIYAYAHIHIYVCLCGKCVVPYAINTHIHTYTAENMRNAIKIKLMLFYV